MVDDEESAQQKVILRNGEPGYISKLGRGSLNRCWIHNNRL